MSSLALYVKLSSEEHMRCNRRARLNGIARFGTYVIQPHREDVNVGRMKLKTVKCAKDGVSKK